ncbi:hypothetical protein D9758_000976 [Tetrapyrgos nigripes]|uniref:Transmembrane protein n=1 Tax=Tetrapyrgos nigripes TaxID=182062 RepID=A0A8H5LY45_9AGAR|nr:hypothetical protein D9758_000976 [Tetrapyrgos nigripes]
MPRALPIWPGALLFLLLLRDVLGVAVNRTIDDSLGDSVTGQRPIFLPSTGGVWEDQTCAGCAIQPNRSLAFSGTWTAATYNPNLRNISTTFTFRGICTAIYIFFILANNEGPDITTVTECNFTLDGTVVGHFLHQPNASISLVYGDDAMVFSKTGLANGNHTFQISTAGLDHNVYVNFDYAIYTFQRENGVPPSSSSSVSASLIPSSASDDYQNGSKSVSSGAIAGGVLGCLAALLALVGLFFFLYRRRRRSKPTSKVEGASGPLTSPHLPLSGASDNARLPQSTSISSIHTQSQHAPAMAFVASTARASEEYHGSSRERSRAYISRDVVSSLPSGQIVMMAGMQRSDSVTTGSTIPTALPSTANPFNPIMPSPFAVVSLSDTPRIHPAPNTKAELRHMRQRELERQMEDIKQEMKGLQMEAAERHASIKSSNGRRARPTSNLNEEEDVSKLKEQIRQMHSQISSLQDQFQSPWALGLSDDPPPGYSPQ